MTDDDAQHDRGGPDGLEARLQHLFRARTDGVRSELDGPGLRAAADRRAARGPRADRGRRLGPALAAAAAVAVVAGGVAAVAAGGGGHGTPAPPGGGSISGGRTTPSSRTPTRAPSQPPAQTSSLTPSPTGAATSPGSVVLSPSGVGRAVDPTLHSTPSARSGAPSAPTVSP